MLGSLINKNAMRQEIDQDVELNKMDMIPMVTKIHIGN